MIKGELTMSIVGKHVSKLKLSFDIVPVIVVYYVIKHQKPFIRLIFF